MEQNTLAVSSGTMITPHRQATDVAGICKEIVLKTAQNIQGRKYVRVEGWQSIANAFGCVASAKNVTRCETGITAVGQVRNMATGIVIAEAEGFVGFAEKTWGNREEYAQRAMAQTRAISRACRSAFAFVVTMMDAGLETTPAEEVPSEGFSDNNRPSPRIVDAEVIKPHIVSRELVNAAAESAQPRYANPDNFARDMERKKKPVAASREAADFTTVVFKKVARKSGESAKGPWTRWGMLVTMPDGSETWLNTFSKEFGAMIDSANEGDPFNAELKRGERGIDIVDLLPGNVPTKPEEAAEDSADLDEIPF